MQRSACSKRLIYIKRERERERERERASSICSKPRIYGNWMFRLREGRSATRCVTRPITSFSLMARLCLRRISHIRINWRDYDRWSRPYFAIFLSGARPAARDAANCSRGYLWPTDAHFAIASRHFRRLELWTPRRRPQWLSYPP